MHINYLHYHSRFYIGIWEKRICDLGQTSFASATKKKDWYIFQKSLKELLLQKRSMTNDFSSFLKVFDDEVLLLVFNADL